LKAGTSPADDPQYGIIPDFPPVPSVRVIRDGETLAVGPLALTAHFTPGHTPGSTTWTWRSCEADRCLDMVYADSQTPVSADGFLFTKHNGVEQFQHGAIVLDQLRCDVLMTPHPSASSLFERVETKTLVDPEACRRLAATAREALAKRVKAETEKP
jgi:metallo-beta-lactamase class B